MPCTVALVDSGIDPDLYGDRVTEWLDFAKEGEKASACDSSGHGTLCASALLSANPDTELVVVRALDAGNRCSSDTVVLALERLAESDADIVSLSLCTDHREHEGRYRKAIDRLNRRGKLVLAAGSNRGQLSLPAELPRVVGVAGNRFRDPEEYWYQSAAGLQCVADHKPVLLPGLGGRYELFGGNSKACALFAGILSRHWEELDGAAWKEREAVMQSYAKRVGWKPEDIVPQEPHLPPAAWRGEDAEIFAKLKRIVCAYLGIPREDAETLRSKPLYEFGITRRGAADFLRAVEDGLGIGIDYSQVSFYWFYSVELLYSYIAQKGVGAQDG
jgi:hypothetical protein